MCSVFFFFNDTATTEIYTLSLHDALPILTRRTCPPSVFTLTCEACSLPSWRATRWARLDSAESMAVTRSRSTPSPCEERSEEHTSELQSRQYLVCRLLLEKKNIFTLSIQS